MLGAVIVLVVLVFIGLKMVLDPHENPPAWYQMEIPTAAALGLTVLIIGISIVASIIAAPSPS